MDRNRLVLVGVIVVIAIICFAREWSWRSHTQILQENISSLTSKLDAVTLRLEIEEQSKFTCKSDDHNATMVNVDSFSSDKLIPVKPILPAKVLVDSSGFVQVALTILAKLCEVKYMHNDIYDESKYTNYDGNRRFLSFISRTTPVSTLITFTLMYVLAWFAWFGLISRSSYSYFSLKFVICWAWGGSISQVINNTMKIIRYLPKSQMDWFNSLKSPSWWIWIVSRVAGADDWERGITSAIRFVAKFLIIWPCRYFFFHKSSCKNEVSTDIFLTNMLIQASFLIMWVSSVHLLLFGSPGWVRKWKSLGSFFPLLRDSAKISALWVVLAGLSVLLVIVRVLHFIWTAGPTWWGSAVAFAFLNVHILVLASNFAIIAVQMTRFRFEERHKSTFIDAFVTENRKKTTTATPPSAADTDTPDQSQLQSPDELQTFAGSLFSALADRTYRDYIFGAGPVTYFNYRERKAAKDEAAAAAAAAAARDDKTKSTSEENEESVDDLALAFEQVKFVFSLAHAHYEDAVREVEARRAAVTSSSAGSVQPDAAQSSERAESTTESPADPGDIKESTAESLDGSTAEGAGAGAGEAGLSGHSREARSHSSDSSSSSSSSSHNDDVDNKVAFEIFCIEMLPIRMQQALEQEGTSLGPPTSGSVSASSSSSSNSGGTLAEKDAAARIAAEDRRRRTEMKRLRYMWTTLMTNEDKALWLNMAAQSGEDPQPIAGAGPEKEPEEKAAEGEATEGEEEGQVDYAAMKEVLSLLIGATIH